MLRPGTLQAAPKHATEGRGSRPVTLRIGTVWGPFVELTPFSARDQGDKKIRVRVLDCRALRYYRVSRSDSDSSVHQGPEYVCKIVEVL